LVEGPAVVFAILSVWRGKGDREESGSERRYNGWKGRNKKNLSSVLTVLRQCPLVFWQW
jgi:hypothetical protein